MVPRFCGLFLLVSLLLLGCVPRLEVKAPLPVGPVPSAAQMKWHKMEMNAFIHFSINTFTNKEWGFGDEQPSMFNPTELNVDQWITTLKDAGFQGVILTSKHHDGFCLWPSQFTNHSVKNSPFQNGKGDLVKEVRDACKAQSMKFGIYVSPWDRNHAHYGDSLYIEYYRNQLKELFTAYGPFFEMWFDGANGGDGFYGGANEKRRIDGSRYYDWPTTLNLVKNLEPNVIFFSDAGPGVRWVGNEKGIAGETNWNTITPDTLFAGKTGIESLLNTGSEDGTHWIPAEVDVSIRPGWFYHPQEDSLVKTGQQLFDIYLTSVGRGATLLLNVPPDNRGLFHEHDVKALQDFKAIRDRAFKTDLAKASRLEVSSFRGNLEQYSKSKLTDGDPETYWATDDTVHDGLIELEFDSVKKINFIELQEYIKLGQRVKKFEVKAWIDSEWRSVANGTTIGYKRILKVDAISTKRIRIRFSDAKGCLVISNLSLY